MMPMDLNRLTEGWLELESDPGLFTLLLEDFGVNGIQVEEIYDLQKSIEAPVYGFIFLFKWIEERRSRRKQGENDGMYVQDDKIVNSIFFAEQIVPNSCATHALLSVLLNCENIHLGETLTRLKDYTHNMTPENKGYAIVNTPELAKAHNIHAIPEPRRLQEKTHGVATGGRHMETFHFVSYVPIHGRLFELDGLKRCPIDHGPWNEGEDWTEKFRRVITDRLGIATGGEPYHDIRFNLMAVVPDRRIAFENKLRTLKTNRQIVLEALQQLVKLTFPELTKDDVVSLSANRKQRKKKTRIVVKDSGPDSCSSTTSSSSGSSSTTCKLTDSIAQVERLGPGVKIFEGLAGSVGGGRKGEEEGEDGSSFSLLHPALVIHNYAKQLPNQANLVGGNKRGDAWNKFGNDLSTDQSSEEDEVEDGEGSQRMKPPLTPTDPVVVVEQLQLPGGGARSKTYTRSGKNFSPLKPIHVNTTDYSRPLSIQTMFDNSPTPSASSTDTASEVGSAFNSPVRPVPYGSGQSSPIGPHLKDIKKFVVIRMSKEVLHDSPGEEVTDASKSASASAQSKKTEPAVVLPKVETDEEKLKSVLYECTKTKYPQLQEPHNFAPKDLLALLKNIENEISTCEANLKDEIEKRRLFKIDDSRRTHNYDDFVVTFLSMLAYHGKLDGLMEEHSTVKKRQGTSSVPKKDTRRVDKRRRRPRPKPPTRRK